MLPSYRVVMTGDFDKKIAEALGLLESNKRSCVMPMAELMQTRWRQRAPYDSIHHKQGEQHYRDSIKVEVMSENAYGVVIQVASDKWYADLLEYGDSKMAAEPSFRPALDRTSQDGPALIGEALMTVLRK